MEIPGARWTILRWWLPAMLGLPLLGPAVRAQITENPYTMPPGTFLLDAGLRSLRLDRHDPDQEGKDYSAQVVFSTLLATGLTKNVDFQVGVDLFFRESFNLQGAHDSRSGLGDVRLRTKYTFWSDPALGVAAAVIPYVKIPAHSEGVGNGAVEGGVIVPWATGLPGRTHFGAMAEWDVVRNGDNTGYDSVWYVAGLLTQPLTQSVSFYGESTLAVSSAKVSDAFLTLGGGANLQFSSSKSLDLSLHRGIGRAAGGWNPVVRLKWKF